MGLFSALSNWSNNKYEQKVEKMKDDGKCPDCSGRGIELYPYDYYYTSANHCPGCNGSGLFEDWMK